MNVKLSIVCVLAVAAIALCANGAPTNEEAAKGTSEQVVRSGFAPAKLFDFANYKTLFHKSYSGLVEEMVRAKYYLSRAFRAFITALKYKHHQSPNYLAVNDMSDWTQEEIEASQDKVLAEMSERTQENETRALKSSADSDADEVPEMLPEDAHKLEEALKKIAREAKPGQVGYDELKEATGESSSTASRAIEGQSGNVRDLPMEKLIDTGADAQLSPEAASKLTQRVASNNPQYAPLELQSFGLRDEPKAVQFWNLDPMVEIQPINAFSEAVVGAIKNIAGHKNKKEEEEEEDDEDDGSSDRVFVDLREDNCFTQPRQQGQCAASYAFAGTAIFEYLYCIKTQKLVPFSEQYMIDCGPEYINGADGCKGGTAFGVADFVKNFGLELRVNYPYNMRQNECPYEESMELKQTGYIRFGFNNAVEIDSELWPEYLEHGPLLVAISEAPGFREHGGGLFGLGCKNKKLTHALLLVGHGRQDGEEYWLVRNSFSPSWGEGGYGKLAKSAGCTDKKAFAFATTDGKRYQPRIRTNEHNDPNVIKKHNEQMALL